MYKDATVVAKKAYELPVISLYIHQSLLLTPTFKINPRAKGRKIQDLNKCTKEGATDDKS